MLNSISVYGRLVVDAQTYMFEDNRGMVNFSIAQDYQTKEKGQPVKKTNFFDCTAPFTSVAQYLTKGKAVIVSGRINQNCYTDKNGFERKGYRITATEIQLLDDAPKMQSGEVNGGNYGGMQPAQPQQVNMQPYAQPQQVQPARQVEQTPYSMEDPNSPPF